MSKKEIEEYEAHKTSLYDLAKEMYSEDNYLVTPILLQWLKTLSGVSRFVINPNFQDFVFTYKEETKVVASDDNHYQNEC